ncbi:MAG: aminomethyl-transferring glycine dehydrogenase [Polyangiaceae bacterium]|nr:aminomethyl-transferring glycine dehydrogenase [Polyangiaceae bacterium]
MVRRCHSPADSPPAAIVGRRTFRDAAWVALVGPRPKSRRARTRATFGGPLDAEIHAVRGRRRPSAVCLQRLAHSWLTARVPRIEEEPDVTRANESPPTPLDPFVYRHLGSRPDEIAAMLAEVGYESLDALADATVPEGIRLRRPLALGPPRGEREVLEELRALGSRNERFRSFIGMGYYGTVTPAVIQRNVLENPGWYTQYTPYQAEIAQGRLEALLNFQTLVSNLTALPLANASLLDEGTAAAEAMMTCRTVGAKGRRTFLVAPSCHPQTIAVVRTRAEPLGIEVRVGETSLANSEAEGIFGVLMQYPASDGTVSDLAPEIARLRAGGALVVLATDLLALTLLVPPGELGADIAVGSTQRFGVPMGYGGPHAAFFATRDEFRRFLPGRIVGVSHDTKGRTAYRLALQTREQHIRRERATSNICTAQVLLAVIAGFYAVYHGPDGLRTIAERVRRLTEALAAGLRELEYEPTAGPLFDTLTVPLSRAERERVLAAAREKRVNLRELSGALGVSLDETATPAEVALLLGIFAPPGATVPGTRALFATEPPALPPALDRQSPYLTAPVFHAYRTEHELLRYIHRLEARDLSLTTSMIPLGSCTMKLTGAVEMLPITWPEFADLHPFQPAEQAAGYRELFRQLARWLAEIAGMHGVSLQPNSGAQGEYAGLLVVRAYHRARGEVHRDVCLIPSSAHGTNPASATLAGLRVVAVACDQKGNVDVADLRAKIAMHGNELAVLMVTYPSTHGVFETAIQEICSLVHEAGGQVYMDGANMNAQVGLCRPGDIGADVCHLNLHKTFAIPHGGGGPGMGPIAVREHLVPFLPGHPVLPSSSPHAIGPICAAPFGSASILPIAWVYVSLMGAEGLRLATELAILNANYLARRLETHYPVLFRGQNGLVAHEFVLDCRALKKEAGIEVDDVAKRLMDYGFHAPTMSWPVHDTLMIEPTESESKGELDRFCAAMLAIRDEVRAIAAGTADPLDNPLKNAPHPALDLAADWPHPYSRELAVFPLPNLREHKYWPAVSRIDNAAGDRHLVCTCASAWAHGTR